LIPFEEKYKNLLKKSSSKKKSNSKKKSGSKKEVVPSQRMKNKILTGRELCWSVSNSSS